MIVMRCQKSSVETSRKCHLKTPALVSEQDVDSIKAQVVAALSAVRAL